MKQPTQLGRRDVLRLGIGLVSAGELRADLPIPVVTKVVKTTNGDVQGLVKDGVQVLKGIRYGAPPVGPLRFMPPQRPKPWKGVADATEFGAPAIQMAAFGQFPQGRACAWLGERGVSPVRAVLPGVRVPTRLRQRDSQDPVLPPSASEAPQISTSSSIASPMGKYCGTRSTAGLEPRA